MMKLLWPSCLLFSFSWTYALSIYAPSDFGLWALFILAGFLSSLYEFYRKGGRKLLTALKNAIFYGLSILLTQIALLPFFDIWQARNHAESLLSPLMSMIMNLFGVPATSEGALIYMDAPLKAYSFLSTWEKIGILYLFLFSVGILISLFLNKEMKRALKLIPMLFLYFILRYAFLIMLYNTYFMHSLFWERRVAFVSFIPLALLLMSTESREKEPLDFKIAIKWDKSHIITAILFALFAVSATLFFSNIDLGREKQGRVIIDEYHSDWEWTTEVYDENWYGERSGYNYYCFYDYIDKYYQTKINQKPLDKKLLEACDVLILKTPTKPYSDEEVEAIVSYVENGGGLYLIGDHTNVFGTGVNLNRIAEHFNLSFNYDCTYELVGGNLSTYQKPKLFSHKALGEMDKFLFATSCTLNAPWYAEDVIVGYGLKNLQADYSQKNFFPEDQNSPHLEYGLFLQSAALKYKEGRVLAYTDSTVFSNFWMFMKGKPELLLGSLRWLNRDNFISGLSTRALFGGSSALLLAINLLWYWKRRNSYSILTIVLPGLLGFLIVILSVQVINRATYEAAQPIKDMVNIGFERNDSDYELPDDLEGFKSNTEALLTTFYVWTQRLGYYPKSHDTLTEALEASELSVLVRPKVDVGHIDEILSKVEGGAKLLILDSSKYGAHSNPLLERIGLKLEDGTMHSKASYEEIVNIPLSEKASAIIGGKPIIKDGNGNTVFAIRTVGKGFIAVFSDPDLFYNHHLGDVSMNLTPKTEVLSKLEFKIMKQLIALKP